MRMFREFEEAQAFVDAVTKTSVIERVESHAAQRRLKQMQLKQEKDARRKESTQGERK